MRILASALLVGVAIATIALAAPAGATAAEWKHKGEPLAKHVEFGVTGIFSFGSVMAGYGCEVSGTITTEGGESAFVTALAFKKPCAGNGALEGCKLEEGEATNLPWIIQLTEADMVLNGVTYDLKFEGCGVEGIEVSFPELTAKPDNAGAIGKLALSGEGVVYALGLEMPAETQASFFTFEKAVSGTYGIG